MSEPKLPAGMYKRGSTYYGSWYEGTRRVRRALGSSLDRALAEFRRQRTTSPPPSERGMTFAQAVSLYLVDVADRHPDKPRTTQTARAALKAPIAASGDVALSTLTDDHWRDFVRSRRSKVAPATMFTHSRYVRACLRWAVQQGFVREMPFNPRVKQPTQKKARFLTTPQIRQLLDNASDRTYPLIFPPSTPDYGEGN